LNRLPDIKHEGWQAGPRNREVSLAHKRNFRRPRGGDPLLSIGVFARRSRLSMKALRLYDHVGLLKPAQVDLGTGYRRYRESQLATARLVVMLRRLDMPLVQVAEIVFAPGPLGAERLASYWEAFERRVASQRELLGYIRGKLLGTEASVGLAEIRQREVPEQLVLTEQRHIDVDHLPAWIGAAMSRLTKLARRYGGPVGARFVVYYGEINEDKNGPAEACVPVDPARAPARNPGIRREPAHCEAYVRLTKAQVAFPQISSAYDRVSAWVTSQGLTPAGHPREVYFGDFAAAGPRDEVCDVAVPMR
jgi:DNA-binding transcriptional MerR regulator